ncbi:Basic helix-loop-helix transcription factor [Parasponia andersonii]|uniref:Basic helix-loop-helix transcription factor n=1 Tax=Parasponia andersonii TaxID=3476 RepID=A0A2P5BGW4_PARAD|nr:Basic helix-loop-helix transcription factor [Parasponia andersonii]
MALEALSNSNELFNFVIYDTISATPCSYQDSSETTITNFLFNNDNTTAPTTLINPPPPPPHHQDHQVGALETCSLTTRIRKRQMPREAAGGHDDDDHRDIKQSLGAVVVRKKRRRKPRVCKNKEEAESQRMTHIAVERNRRKQMNEHLAVLRSLMPESYVQRGDQASIVGGAIEFVKGLEYLLQSLESQKLQVLQGINNNGGSDHHDHDHEDSSNINSGIPKLLVPPPFAQFFVYPQYTWSQISNNYTSNTNAAIADIEVTLIETHANLRIFSRRSPKQLSKLIAGFQTLHLTVLHLNVTTLNALVLYSVSVKVEEACLLTSVDDIAAAVHHMLRIIEEEVALC